jgi:outer membrane murein-binding lipoprotein Lpp
MQTTGLWRAFRTSFVFAALALSGCSSMNKTECLATDWRTVGYEDGVAGQPGDHISHHRKACSKHGVTPNFSAYQAGRTQGLKEYCQPANGYELGVRGASYRGVCPEKSERAFLAAFEDGHELYTLRARVSDTKARLGAKRRDLDRAQHGVVASSADVMSDETSKEERADALVDAAQLAERVGRLKAEIRQLEKDQARREGELEAYLRSRGR